MSQKLSSAAVVICASRVNPSSANIFVLKMLLASTTAANAQLHLRVNLIIGPNPYILIRLLLWYQSNLGPYCLQNRLRILFVLLL